MPSVARLLYLAGLHILKSLQMRHVIFVTVLLFFSAQAGAGEVAVIEAWTRATAPGQDSGVVYMRISSQKNASIIVVSSPVAGSAGLHSMTHENGVMKMRELEALPLPAGQEVVLASGGNHLMLNDLKRPLKAGDTVAITLTVQYADKRKKQVQVKAEVRPLTTSHDMHKHHHDHK